MMAKNKKWTALAAAGCVALAGGVVVLANWKPLELRPAVYQPAFRSWLPPALDVRPAGANAWRVSYPADPKELPVAPLGEPHVSLEFGYPVSLRAVKLAAEPGAIYKAWVMVTDDQGSLERLALGEAAGAEVEMAMPAKAAGRRVAWLGIAYKPGAPSLDTFAVLPPARITHDGGKAYVTPAPDDSGEFDDMGHPTRSTLHLLEDGKRLGPPHSMHDQIRKLGAGRYSHWSTTILFSASDDSDPRSNGRKYGVARVRANELTVRVVQ